MFRKLFLAHLSLLVAALAVSGVWVSGSTRRRVLEQTAARLEAEAVMLRALSRPPQGLQETLHDLGARLGSRLTVVGADGTVLADSHALPASMDNHNGRPEIRDARASGRGENVRHSDTVRVEMLYVALRMDPDRPDGAVVRSALPLTRVDEEMGEVTRGVAIAFVALALAGAGLSFLLARRITRPLRELRDVAQWAAVGDFTRRAPVRADPEVASVGAALNRMTDELASRLERLEAERSKIAAVLGSMQEAVVAVDRAGSVERSNAAAEALLGVGREALGHLLWEVLRLPGLEEAAVRAIREGVTGRLSAEVGPRAVAMRLTPIAGSGGAVLVAHDVTEELRYEALRKEFVANVSHELRTPLTLVQGYVETLRNGAWKEPERAPEFLDTIERNVARLRTLVEDLLQISRLESAGQILQPRETAAAGILDRVRETFRPLAERKRQELSVEAPPGLVLVADPELLERAVGNFVDNAIKYTPEGGRVRARAWREGEAVLFAVEDTGIGIPEADQPRIFERFYRVDKSRSRDLGGTGLGLAIVKHIAQLHGGAVAVASAPGKGSVFTLRLPAGSFKPVP